MKRSSLLLLVAFTFLPSILEAQVLQTGDIRGRAMDTSGGVLSGVTVTLTSPVLITPKTATTDDQL